MSDCENCPIRDNCNSSLGCPMRQVPVIRYPLSEGVNE